MAHLEDLGKYFAFCSLCQELFRFFFVSLFAAYFKALFSTRLPQPDKGAPIGALALFFFSPTAANLFLYSPYLPA
jgi:hypothetical protein